MNVDPVKPEMPNIPFKIVIENLDLLSKLECHQYLSVDRSTYELSVRSWWRSSYPSEFVKAIEATFFAATQNLVAPEIKTRYAKSYGNLFKLENTYSFDKEALKLIQNLRHQYSEEGKIDESKHPKIARARTAFVGGKESRMDRLTQEWVFTRWQMNMFLRELQKLKLVPEYKEVCAEVKQCLPKAPPATPEGLAGLLSQLNEAKSRLNKIEGDPIESRKPKKLMIQRRMGFAPTKDELGKTISSLTKPELVEVVEEEEQESPIIIALKEGKKALKDTGLKKMIQEEENRSTVFIASKLEKKPTQIADERPSETNKSEAIFRLSPLQEQIYEMQESFETLGPKEKLLQLLDSAMSKVFQIKEQLHQDQESSEEGESTWSSEEAPCIEINLEDLEGLTDSEDSEELLEDHVIDPQYKEACGQVVTELKTKQSTV